jgi:hypothetical protein
MPTYEITDEQLIGFQRTLLTIWKSLGQSPPSLDPEREQGREVSRALLGGMLMAYHLLFGAAGAASLRRSAEEALTQELGYVPSTTLESASAEGLAAFMAATLTGWDTSDGV